VEAKEGPREKEGVGEREGAGVEESEREEERNESEVGREMALLSSMQWRHLSRAMFMSEPERS
jgi:hypothetical protein